jgi:hypothetical protein
MREAKTANVDNCMGRQKYAYTKSGCIIAIVLLYKVPD